MTRLTISIDEQVLSRARFRAAEEGTSIEHLLRAHLEGYAGVGSTSSALTSLARLARASTASSGPGGRTWTREELDDRTAVP
jgi:hypothetical protein